MVDTGSLPKVREDRKGVEANQTRSLLGPRSVFNCRDSPILPYDEQRQVRHEIEHQKEDLEQPEEAVHHHVEGLAGNRKPAALRAVHEVGGKQEHDSPQDQQGPVDDGAPHEEGCEGVELHDRTPS